MHILGSFVIAAVLFSEIDVISFLIVERNRALTIPKLNQGEILSVGIRKTTTPTAKVVKDLIVNRN